MSNTYLPGCILAHFSKLVRLLPDEVISRPLWEFKPRERKAVLSERTRRFGARHEEEWPNG